MQLAGSGAGSAVVKLGVLDVDHAKTLQGLAVYHSDFAVTAKDDASPVTEADLQAERIILAGLLVGASLLMRVPTHFQMFGFPGLAILCFTAAATGGFWLVISIFVHDYKTSRKFPR